MIIPKIVMKNLKILFRSPFTIGLLILAPILLMISVGITYSGAGFNSITIGSIQSDISFLNSINGISYEKYDYNDIKESTNKCKEDLRNSKIEMCIYSKVNYDENRKIRDIDITYYVDNTRPQLSERLVSNFDRIIDAKTKEISTKTVTNIFDEIKKSIEFLEDSQKLIVQIENDLDEAETFVEKTYDDLLITKKSFDKIYLDLESSAEIIDDRNLVKDIDSTIGVLKDTKETVEVFRNNFNDYKKTLDSVIFYLNAVGEKELSDDVKDLKNNLNEIYSNSNKLIFSINNGIKNLEKLKQNVEQFQNKFRTVKNSLELFDKNFDDLILKTQSLLEKISSRKKNLQEINSEITSKITNFKSVSNKDARDITEPIKKRYFNLFSGLEAVHQLSPVIVILITLFLGLLLSNVIVALEIKSKAYFRNLISPIPQSKYIISLIITSFIIIFMQIMILLLILSFYFNIEGIFFVSLANTIQIFIVILHLLILFILVGVFIAYHFQSVQISTLVTTFVILFLFLLSDLLLPIQIMPKYLASILQYNPVIIGENLFRLLFFQYNTFSLKFTDLIPIYPMIIVFIILIKIASNSRKKKLY